MENFVEPEIRRYYNKLPTEFKNFYELYKFYKENVKKDGEDLKKFLIRIKLPTSFIKSKIEIYEEYTFDVEFVKARSLEFLEQSLPTKEDFMQVRRLLDRHYTDLNKSDSYIKFSNFFFFL